MFSLRRFSPLSKYSPHFEIRIHHPVGEALTTDTDPFKYTVTGELMHHQVRVNETWRERTILELPFD
jgi:hypothetical protein